MKQNKRILLLGASGKVGRYFWKRLKPQGALGTYGLHPIPQGVHFDIQKDHLGSFMSNFDDFSTAIVLLGETEPDTCARNKKYSEAVNVTYMKSLLDTLINYHMSIVFASTEFVFDGGRGHYKETDVPKPILTYGEQKRTIEDYLHQKTDRYLVTRFGKVYGDTPGDGTLFTSWIEKLLKGEDISVANDQVFSPIWAEDLVTAVLGLIEKEAHGIYHVAGPRAVSRKSLFEMTVKKLANGKAITPYVLYKSIDDFGLAEKRPHNVSLDISKLIKTTGFTPSDPETVCGTIIKKYFL